MRIWEAKEEEGEVAGSVSDDETKDADADGEECRN